MPLVTDNFCIMHHWHLNSCTASSSLKVHWSSRYLKKWLLPGCCVALWEFFENEHFSALEGFGEWSFKWPTLWSVSWILNRGPMCLDHGTLVYCLCDTDTKSDFIFTNRQHIYTVHNWGSFYCGLSCNTCKTVIFE